MQRDEAAAGEAARPTVWLLEDSPMEAAMARRALSASYDVEIFSDGSTLIERIAEGQTPSVMVLDVQLPGISGVEVCRFLRGRFDETALPVLMLTVYGHKSDLIEGLAAGANDYLTKPYDAPELLARVGTLSRVRQLHETARRAEEERSDLFERERAARREAEAANQAKDEFLAAMVSHELRTPLNAILGWTRMLRTANLAPEQQQRALETVERNALAQAQLIEDLLDMARIISGKLTIGSGPVEMVSVIHRALDAMRPTLEAKQIVVELAIHPDGAVVLGDDVRLQQVAWNLLSNAIKFSAKGGRIVVGMDRVDGDVQLSVKDFGRGIEPSFLPHVFERFRQGEDGSKRSHGGLGLGLAIVKFIAGLHGGSVAAASAGVGTGATFAVRLPRFEKAAAASAFHLHPPAPLSPAASARLTGLRVLLVDDDPDGLELVAAMLRRDGAEVQMVASAEAVLAELPLWRPDVLVSDIGMPGMDGYELVRRIRALEPDKGGRTPALALTAFAHPQDRTRALAAGFNIYVPKPVDPTELAVSVANLAGRFPGR
ncbi:MAG: response regulator [Polyangiaceae bacterium]